MGPTIEVNVLSSRHLRILAASALLLVGAAPVTPAPVPAEGTVGTEILLTGEGFGERRGKVFLVFDDGSKRRRLKARRRNWSDGSVRCTLKKLKRRRGPRSGRIVLRPKGGEEIDLGAFRVRLPEILSAPLSGDRKERITVSGRWFGKKRGRLFLLYEKKGRERSRRMKVKRWEMDPTTGESTAVAVVPKKIPAGTSCELRVKNRVGVGETVRSFFVEPPEGETPAVRILWPPPAGRTEASTVEVRGTTASAVGLSGLRVGGVPAESDDGYLTWRAVVGVPPGVTRLDVETVDAFGNVVPDAASLVVRSAGPGLPSPFAVAFDPDGGRAIAVTLLEPAVLAIDPATGVRTLLSGRDRGAGPEIGGPTGLAVEPGGGRAYVVDAAAGAVLRVALGGGDRTVVSGPGAGGGPDLRRPAGAAMDPDAGRLLLVDREAKAVLSVDVAAGERRVVSDASRGAGPDLSNPRDLCRRPADGRLFVVDGEAPALLAVDPDSGDRTTVSSAARGTGPDLVDPWGVLFLAGRVLVADCGRNGILSIDPATGDRTALDGPGPALEGPWDLCADAAAGRLLAAEFHRPALTRVEIATGARSDVTEAGAGAGPEIGDPRDAVWDSEAGVVCLADAGGGPAEIEAATGNRRRIPDGKGPLLETPWGVALAPGGTHLLVTDAEAAAVLRIKRKNGARTRLDSGGPALAAPAGIAVDGANGRALVADLGADAIVAVDLGSGAREVLSGPDAGGGPPLRSPWFVRLDPPGDRALVVEQGGRRLLAVDLRSGDRSTLSSAEVGAGPEPAAPRGLAVDPARRLAWTVADGEGGDILLEIDLSSGDRRVVEDPEPGGGSGPAAMGVALDPECRILFLAFPGGVRMADLEGGDRLLLSR